MYVVQIIINEFAVGFCQRNRQIFVLIDVGLPVKPVQDADDNAEDQKRHNAYERDAPPKRVLLHSDQPFSGIFSGSVLSENRESFVVLLHLI